MLLNNNIKELILDSIILSKEDQNYILNNFDCFTSQKKSKIISYLELEKGKTTNLENLNKNEFELGLYDLKIKNSKLTQKNEEKKETLNEDLDDILNNLSNI